MARKLEDYYPPIYADGLVTDKNATFGGNVTVTGNLAVTGTQTLTGAPTFTGVVNANTAGIRTKQAVNNVNDTTPTAAELATSFGAAATLGRGFIGTIDDNDGDAISYIVWTSDASFYFVIGTKAS